MARNLWAKQWAALQVYRSAFVSVRTNLRSVAEEVRCGWLADKFGVSWQIVPTKISKWASDTVGFQRVMHAVMPIR